jgi:hypothetical protein
MKKCLLRGEGEQDGDPSHPPPPIPSAYFWARTHEFSEKPADLWRKVVDLRKRWRICEKSGGFEANSQVASFGETMADFP